MMSMQLKSAHHPFSYILLALGIGLVAHERVTAGTSQPSPETIAVAQDAPPAVDGATITVKTRDITVRVPEELRRDVGTIVVVETDGSPLPCEGPECMLNDSSKKKSKSKFRGVVASAAKAAQEVDLFPFECSDAGCKVGANSLATVTSEAFAEATQRASNTVTKVELNSGESLRTMKAPEVILGAKLRRLLETVARAKKDCIRAAIPNAIFRKQEWGEDLPNSIIVTYRQPLPDQGFTHEIRADLFFLLAYPIEQFETRLASETIEFQVDSVINSHRVHVATGAKLRGFSLSKDRVLFEEIINTCLNSL